MRNCIVAQSGGPTSVINSSIVGLLQGNKELNLFNKVYGGLNGIEGILNNSIVNLSNLSFEDLKELQYTPSSFLGSCRYKLPNIEDSSFEYEKLMLILKKLEIDTFFYIGGNDSMDTVAKLSEYALSKRIPIQFIGIPKTIDNDLVFMDHSPGFISASNFILTSILETYLDFSVYSGDGIFILETMGRDAGWLAASSCVANFKGRKIVDYIYLPEVPFNIDNFLKDIKSKLDTQGKVYIVVSEGIKDADGNLISKYKYANTDSFGHVELGGVSNRLKTLLIQNGVTAKIRSVELSTLQRCAMHCSSDIDINEAFEVGFEALNIAKDNLNGYMPIIKRLSSSPYKSKIVRTKASYVANQTRYFPKEWINKDGNNINSKALKYFLPLLSQTPFMFSNNSELKRKVINI